MKSNRTKDLLIRIAKAAAVPLIAWAIMQVIDMAFAGMGVINNAADVKTLFRNLISSLAFALAIGANLNCGRMDLSLGAQMYAGVIFGGNIALMFHLGGIGVLLLSMVVGGICGLVIGFVFIKLRILPMVLGLGMTLVFECVCFAINNQQGVILFGKPGVDILSNITFVIIMFVLVCNFTEAYYLCMRYQFFIYTFQSVLLLLFLRYVQFRYIYIIELLVSVLMFPYFCYYFSNGTFKYANLSDIIITTPILYFVKI